MSSELLFIDEDDSPLQAINSPLPWNILVVDDDHSVHAATKFAFMQAKHRERPIALRSAFSGLEAIDIILNSRESLPDLVLMDVVMATPTDGIDATHRIRQLLDQQQIPYVIIRTGQAGTLKDENALKHDPSIDDVIVKGGMTVERLTAAVFRGLDSVQQRLDQLG